MVQKQKVPEQSNTTCVAQSVERESHNLEAEGSKPSAGTFYYF